MSAASDHEVLNQNWGREASTGHATCCQIAHTPHHRLRIDNMLLPEMCAFEQGAQCADSAIVMRGGLRQVKRTVLRFLAVS